MTARTIILLPVLQRQASDTDFMLNLIPQIAKAGEPYELLLFVETNGSGELKARNQLFKWALERSGWEFVVTISSDVTELPQNWLTTLIEQMEQHPHTVGALAPYQITDWHDGRGYGQIEPVGKHWVPEDSALLNFGFSEAI